MVDSYSNIAESKFNEGVAKLNRIGEQRVKVMRYRTKKQWEKLFDCLVNIRTEVWERLDDIERQKVKDYEISLRKEFLSKSNRIGINSTNLENYEDFLQEV